MGDGRWKRKNERALRDMRVCRHLLRRSSRREGATAAAQQCPSAHCLAVQEAISVHLPQFDFADM